MIPPTSVPFILYFRPHLGAAIHAQAWVLRRCISTFNLIARKNCYPRDPDIPGSSREDLGSSSDGSLTDDGYDTSTSASTSPEGEDGEEEDDVEVDELVGPLSELEAAPTPTVKGIAPTGTVEEGVPTNTVEEVAPPTVEGIAPTLAEEEDVTTGAVEEVAPTDSDLSKDVEASSEEPECNFAAFIY